MIHESYPDLILHLSRSTSAANTDRILMLMIRCDYPEASVATIASILGRSPETVRGWEAVYAEDGLDGLQQMVNRSTPTTASSTSDPSGKAGTGSASIATDPRLLFAELATIDHDRWLPEAQAILCDRFFPDLVDQVMIAARLDTDLLEPEKNRHGKVIRDDYLTSAIDLDESGATYHYWKEILVSIARTPQASSLGKSRFPVAMDHYYRVPEARTGTTLFFRHRGHPPLTLGEREQILSLRPIIEVMLMNRILWAQNRNPFLRRFSDKILALLPDDVTLTPTQDRVLHRSVFGGEKGEVLESLAMSNDTYKKHISAILKKFGVRNQAELFGKLLTNHGW